MHFATKLILLVFCFLSVQKCEALTCQRYLSDTGIQASSHQCSTGESCSRIEATTATQTLVGTQCYPTASCVVDDAGCRNIAVFFFTTVTSSNQITSCRAGCCTTDMCNAQSLNGAPSGLARNGIFGFTTLIASLLMALLIAF